MNVQQLARQRIAKVDIAKFAPPSSTEVPAKKTRVALTPEERKARQKAYSHEYYLAHKEEKKAYEKKQREKNPEGYRSNSLKWYYEHRDEQCAKRREWYQKNKEHKTEYMKEWRKKHPGYFSKANKEERKRKRENETKTEHA